MPTTLGKWRNANPPKPWWLFAALPLVLGLSACAEATTFQVHYEPGFVRNGKRVSTFGIKRDGVMSRSGWAVLGPYASGPFSDTRCELGYSDEVFGSTPALAEAMGEYVRANGVTDELLAKLAPAAKGDTIMLVTVTGRPHRPSGEIGGSAAQRAMPAGGARGGGMGRGGMGRGGGGGRATSSESSSASNDPFEISASFFSVEQHRTVARVQMNYAGSDIDLAMREFNDRLEAELRGSRCSGWDWSGSVDDKAIRKLTAQ
jgi:hypothetical protein